MNMKSITGLFLLALVLGAGSLYLLGVSHETARDLAPYAEAHRSFT